MNTILVLALTVFIAALLYAHFALHLTLAEVKAKLHLIHAATAPITGVAAGSPSTPPVDHGATPPLNAGSAGSLVGKPVPNGDTPDTANGSVAYAPAAKKFAPGSRLLMIPVIPYVPAQSSAAFCIAANCGNTTQSERMGGLDSVVAYPAIPNPPETAAVGGPKFHLLGQAPGEKQTAIAGVVSLPSTLTTFAAVDAYLAHLVDYNPNVDYGSGRVGH